MKITPLTYVDEIETTLSFWGDGLGFESIAEDEKKLFGLLENGEQELMVETRKLVKKNFQLLEFTRAGATSYIDVESLVPLMSSLNRVQTRGLVQKTNYGTNEIIVREPGGNLVCFAADE